MDREKPVVSLNHIIGMCKEIPILFFQTNEML